MLSVLRVRHLALIEDAEVVFGPGLNVLTGETGAGKSMLVDALELVLGARGRPELVRSGAAQAEVEALFDLTHEPALVARLAAGGIETSDGELVVRRVLTAQGRSRAYLNGSLVTQGQLLELGAGLADISSQHEHHGLVDPRTHLGYLDAFGALDAERGAMAEAHGRARAARRALDEARGRAAGRGEREDVLRFQIREIDELALRPGEIAELTEERARLRYAEKLVAAAGGAEEALYGRDGSLCGELAQHGVRLAEAAAIDGRLAGTAAAIEAARAQLEEAARDLGHYARSVTIDPDRLVEVEERLHRIGRLGRKYVAQAGTSVEEAILAHRERASAELDGLDSAEERLAALEQEAGVALEEAARRARALSAVRRRKARELGAAIARELDSLGMGGAVVEVRVEDLDGREGDELRIPVEDGSGAFARLSAGGIDRAELLIAPNRGEEARPLRKIASGGELSRAMLAIKRVLAGLRTEGESGARFYVFDEVDAGVGGAVAEVIGKKLKEVAAHHQVLCITHLAPIAVYADRHFFVCKEVVADRTVSSIAALDDRARLDEVARMLGGITVTKKTRQAALELLRGARASAPS